MGVDVRVWVLGLAVLKQNARHHLVNGVDDLEELVIRQVLHGEFPLASVAGVRLPQDSMAIAWDHLAAVESLPGEFSNGVLVDRLAFRSELLLKVLDPPKDLLVGQAVEGASQGIQTRRVREVRIRQRRAHEMRRVGGRVSTLMVRVDGQVQAHEFVESRVVVAQHAAEVPRVIERCVLRHNTVEILATVDDGSNLRQLGHYVQDVFIGVLPQGVLGHTFRIGLCEIAFGLACEDAHGELGHGMHVLGQRVQHGHHVCRQLGPLVELLGE
mmetsp:Transcript_31404/g.91328  ORF Transcript_31404/g.91328 Transcript_31404/m.91328 type:complete len:270 (+) Transcript_31404:619-1428(+)